MISKPVSASGAAAAIGKAGRGWPLVFPALFLGGVWWALFNQVSPDWSLTPQYSYGWFMPPLAGWVAWQRWRRRPAPGGPPARRFVASASVVLLLTLGPILWLRAGNRDWRLIHWALASEASLLSLVVILWSGGWPWARHFLFAVAFPLMAVPWPSWLEDGLIQHMMRTVAGVAVFALQVFNVPAEARGAIIALPVGPVGVDEACSGIQSFQAALVVAAFLGEHYGCLVSERLLLAVFAALWAFFLNIVRAGFLATVANAGGLRAVDRWHDTAGYLVLGLCYAGVFGFAALWAAWAGATTPHRILVRPPPGRRLPWIFGVAGCLWLLAVQGGTHWWFGRFETAVAGAPRWSFHFSNLPPGESRTYSNRERNLLRSDEAEGRVWTDGAGRRWEVNVFRWELGNAGADNARHHRPTICLPDAGFRLESTPAPWVFSAGRARLLIHQYRFESGGDNLDSFYCLWDALDRPGYAEPGGDWDPANWSAKARLAHALEGRRGGGLTMINAGVFGARTADEAGEAFRKILSAAIVPQN